MSLWGRVFAAGYDWFMAGTERKGLAARRKALLASAHGRVLEIGGGTGANLPFYGERIDEVVVTEPEEPMLRRLQKKLGAASVPVRVVHAPAERLPVPDAGFDVAVSTLVLCTVADPARALAEVRRALKPGGRLLFVEHVRSDDPRIARRQDRLHGPWRRFGHGCNTNRATVDTIERSGFTIVELERGSLPGAPSFVRPLVVGVARRD